MAPTAPIEFIGQKELKTCWLSQPMGKSRKFSKGHSAGFVPDYWHAVETMAESEGFGSSGRVDVTASEDSFAPKRRCISVNVDGYDTFGVPSQILSLSKMSRQERKDLESRLKNELDQVRIFQRKVASVSSNTVLLSPSSDTRSCSDVQKRLPLEGVHRSSQSKKRAPPGRNGARSKKGTSGRFNPVKPAAPLEKKTPTDTPPLKKKKITPSDNKIKQELVRRVMTNEEKQKLSMELEALLGELPENIIEFLKEHSGNAGHTGEDEIEIDIDALGDDILFNLRKLIDNYLLEKQKNQSKTEPCEMEIINGPGISNSSLPCKGNDTAEEDIDIVGGNDPPISSYPPIKIEKEAVLKNSKCSSRSSSNNESGSSSSGKCFANLFIVSSSLGICISYLVTHQDTTDASQ
ncbi:hypothetical protein OIU78_016742 [Salix suchowensis]|nr:hypothetical protein OIU78_016742 [Salix suchowensis]